MQHSRTSVDFPRTQAHFHRNEVFYSENGKKFLPKGLTLSKNLYLYLFSAPVFDNHIASEWPDHTQNKASGHSGPSHARSFTVCEKGFGA